MVSTAVADVRGDTATIRFHLKALHHHPCLGTDERTTDGTLYARNVIGPTPEGWKVSSARMAVVHRTGNTDFVSDLARPAAGTGGS